METPETQYTRSGDVHIAYQVFGSGPRNIVCIPGSWSNVESWWKNPVWSQYWRRLASFARVAIFDKRGTGLSDRDVGVAPLEERMDDTRAVMDAAGMKRASLISWSEGGALAILFAATYPNRVDSLVLVGCAPTWRADPSMPGSEKAEYYARTMLDHIEHRFGSGAGFEFFIGSDRATPEVKALYGEAMRNQVSPRGAREVMETLLEIDVRDVLPLITAPTLVATGSEDEITPPELGRYLAEHINGAVLFEQVGPHMPSVPPERGEALFDRIEEFITGSPAHVVSQRVLSTVLFTDIVSSTEELARVGDDAWRQKLDRHDEIVRAMADRYSGRMVKSTGDGALATFDGPGRAVSCAKEIREQLSNLGLQTRAGIHTGEIEVRGDDIAGLAVVLASRIGDDASAGEVLVSRTVTDLVAGSGLRFEDAGTREFKGIPDRWAVYRAL